VTDLNPQAKQMADESMVRNLAAQARAIWPQEVPLLRRYALPAEPRILDAGCGTGEAASRLAELFPRARVLGVDIIDRHLELARSRYARLAPRLAFEHQSVFELTAADGSFDLTVCRHVIQSIPHPDRVIAELARVTRRGGYLHLIAEDYGMLHFQRGALDPRDFWHVAPTYFEAATGTDLFIGRNAYGILAAMKLEAMLDMTGAGEALMDELHELVMEEALVGVEPRPGAIGLLESLGAADVPLGLASNSSREFVERTLHCADLLHDGPFEAIVCAEDAIALRPA